MNNRPSPSGPRNPFRIRTSRNLLPQPLQNQHLQTPLGSAESKGLTPRGFRPQLLHFQHLRAPLVTAENTRLITPLDSALTQKCPRNPFRIRTYEKHGGGGSCPVEMHQKDGHGMPFPYTEGGSCDPARAR